MSEFSDLSIEVATNVEMAEQLVLVCRTQLVDGETRQRVQLRLDEGMVSLRPEYLDPLIHALERAKQHLNIA